MRRQISLVLAFLLASGFIASCGSTKKTSETTESETTAASESVSETTSEDPATKCELPDADWDGREFHVLAKQTSNWSFNNLEVYSEALNGEVLNDAVYNRNLEIENRYNVDITQSLIEDDGDTLRKTVLSGDDAYDLSFNWLVNIGSLAAEGLFADLRSVGYIDFDKPWWNQAAAEALTVSGRLYFTTSDFLLHDKLRSYIVIYNADLAENNQLEDIQSIARDGKWTIEVMDRLGRSVAADLDNDGKMNKGDIFSVMGGAHKDLAMYTESMGCPIVSKDADGKLVITMDSERMVNAIDRFLTLYDKSVSAFPEDFQKDSPSDFYEYGYEIFCSGNALFQSDIVGGLQSMSKKTEFDYKVVPMPKYDEAQEQYLSQPDDITLLFDIPKSAPVKIGARATGARSFSRTLTE